MAKKATKATGKRTPSEGTGSRTRAAKKPSTPKRTPAVRRGATSAVKTPRINAAALGPKAWKSSELAHFKQTILARRQEQLEELDTLKESMMDTSTGEYVSESSNYSLHMEQGTDAMEREKTFLLAARGSKFVTQLDDALARIAAGTYGECRVCGLLIPKERLEAVPTAQTCAEYKNTNVPCERGRMALMLKQKEK